MSFSDQIKAFTAKAEKAADMVFRGTALEVLSAVVMRTPVGNPDLWASKPPPGYTGGTLRGNWQVELNSSARGTVDAKDKDGTPTIRKGSGKISRAKITDSIFITNNLPYAIPVEYGHSRLQRPQGMVRVTVLEFRKIVEANAKKAKR